MKLVTKSDFAKLCKVDPASISYQLKKGKLVLTGDKIDLENEINDAYMNGKLRDAEFEPKEYEVEYTEPQVNHSSDLKGISSLSMAELEKLQKQLAVQKLQKEVEEKQIRIDKANGLLIPYDAVSPLIIQLSKSYVTTFHTAAKNFINEFPKLTPTEAAKQREKLIKEVNRSSKSAVGKVQRDLKAIVNEFSEKRGQGERA